MSNPVRLHELFTITGRPAYVKQAADHSEPLDVPARAWADRANRRYPFHTKEAAFTSSIDAAADQAGDEIIGVLKLAAQTWGCTEDVEAALTKLAQAGKQVDVNDLGDDQFLLVADHQGARLRKFAAVDHDSLETAAQALYDNRHRYPLAWRKTAAIRALARADQLGVRFDGDVDRWLNKVAGFGIPTPETIDRAVALRRDLIRDPELLAKLAQAADALVDNVAARHNSDVVDQFVRALDSCDRQTKIAAHYGARLELPEEVVDITVGDLTKMAHLCGDVVDLQNGRSVEVSKIPREALEGVDPGLAKMAADQLRTVLPTLPRPDADLLVRLIG